MAAYVSEDDSDLVCNVPDVVGLEEWAESAETFIRWWGKRDAAATSTLTPSGISGRG